MTIVRWSLLLPGAVVASQLAYWLIIVGNRITMSQFVDPDSFVGRLFIFSIGTAVSGFVIVYAGVWIAPSHRKHVAALIAGAGLLFTGSGFTYYLAVARDLWSAFGMACAAAGAIVGAVYIFRREQNVVGK